MLRNQPSMTFLVLGYGAIRKVICYKGTISYMVTGQKANIEAVCSFFFMGRTIISLLNT